MDSSTSGPDRASYLDCASSFDCASKDESFAIAALKLASLPSRSSVETRLCRRSTSRWFASGRTLRPVRPVGYVPEPTTGLTPDKDEWISLKVQGVTADFIKGLQAAGFKPDVDEIVGAKVQGITPQFIELARSKGFKNLDLDKLIQLKHAGVLE